MKQYLLFFAFVIVGGIILSGCTNNKKSGDDGVVHSVLVTKPLSADEWTEKHITGIVNADKEISLGFKAAGQVKAIYVKDGQRVKQGTLLAELDDSDYMLGVQAYQVQYDQLEREVARLEKLYKTGSVAGNDYEKAKTGLAQLKVALTSQKNNVAFTKLYAPFDGTVIKVNFQQSEMLDAGMPMFTFSNIGQYIVECNVPLSIYEQKDSIESISGSVGGKELKLDVISLVPKADNNQLFRMILGFNDSKPGTLQIGMSVDVKLTIHNADFSNDMSIPFSALFNKDGKSYVWVVQDSVIVSKEVSVGAPDSKGSVHVFSGLGKNDNVVRCGAHTLQEGEKVRILEDSKETNKGDLL
ncbi:MAG: efflux RND transporter periplasmic adaptor subunit [Paludibacteraceae bacterium]|nr:efflux RND transporter periplasmic adaptor subunit [Paludibacteraceae bacterium]